MAIELSDIRVTNYNRRKGEVEAIRLAKFIARCGICSRRAAERLMADGAVTVNGMVVKEMGTSVSINDAVQVKGEVLVYPWSEKQEISATRLWLHYKPRGFLTTHHDPHGRKTVFEVLPPSMGRHIISIGRLDMNSEGLLLLTNNSTLARTLELPSNGLRRVYECRILGHLSDEHVKQAASGLLVVDGIRYKPILIERLRRQGSDISRANNWVRFTLSEGKNREIRKVCEYFGVQVNRLKRIGYGPFKLGDLQPGDIQEAAYSAFASYLQ